jgi:hypothetical protein
MGRFIDGHFEAQYMPIFVWSARGCGTAILAATGRIHRGQAGGAQARKLSGLTITRSIQTLDSTNDANAPDRRSNQRLIRIMRVTQGFNAE